jgi:hypothetical protein
MAEIYGTTVPVILLLFAAVFFIGSNSIIAGELPFTIKAPVTP